MEKTGVTLDTLLKIIGELYVQLAVSKEIIRELRKEKTEKPT